MRLATLATIEVVIATDSVSLGGFGLDAPSDSPDAREACSDAPDAHEAMGQQSSQNVQHVLEHFGS
jgi:hypothetical protein